jgi:excisionase family DNA binding protein
MIRLDPCGRVRNIGAKTQARDEADVNDVLERPTVERWVTTQEVAEHLSKPISWVRNNAATLPHRRVGNHLRFKLSAVDAWLDEQAGGFSA